MASSSPTPTPERTRIGGIVRDDAQTLVSGASVCAHRLGVQIACTQSGADGRYSIALPAAVYRLRAEGAVGSRLVGQWAFERVDSLTADPVDVRQQDALETHLTLVRGVLLEGTIRAAADQRPLARAQVCLRTLAEPLPLECERTAADGTYRALRAPGQYWVWVIPSDADQLVPQWYDRSVNGVGARAFMLDADARLDMALNAGPRITGRVVDRAGAPVVGALVCADTPFTTGQTCRPTDQAGIYAVTVRPEVYVLNVVPPASSDLVATYHAGKRTWIDADRVAVGPSTTAQVNLTLGPGVRVSGTVRDETGEPVEGANVNLSDSIDWLAGTSTDAAGRYSVVVPPGEYTLEVFAPRYGALVSAEPRPLSVGGAMTVNASLPLGPP